MEIDNRVKCPYPSNIDCICRQGPLCGGFVGFAGFVPDKCPHYKPLRIEELLKVETKLLNKCDHCRNNKNYNSCGRESTCKINTALDVIRNLEREVQGFEPLKKEHKTSSGVTFTGKEKKHGNN